MNGQGLVHRDLKPANIFLATVDGNRIAKIGDYASAVASQRLAALKDALKYGDAGLDLVIQALVDKSAQVMWTAYLLLQQRTEPRVKQALQEYTAKPTFP